MALTRKSLKAMGLTDEQVDSIVEMHTETVDGLKPYKADAERLPEVQRQLEKALADLEAVKKDSFKVKYEALKEEFEGYKSEQTNKETRAAKEKAYRELLKDAGISEKRIDSVLRVSDIEKVELEDGKIKNADELKKSIKTEWADFIVSTNTTGASTHNPPANNPTAPKARDEIMAIKDTSQRQRAWAEYLTTQKGS